MRTNYWLLKLLLAFTLVLLMATASQAQKTPIQRLYGSRISVPEIEQLISALMDSAEVPGLAILEDNKVRCVKTFGYRDVE